MRQPSPAALIVNLHIVHIMSPASYLIPSQSGDPVTMDSIHKAARADVRERMETVAAHLKTVPHHTYVREGEVWESLSDIIRTHEIDLLVVGTHGRTGVERLISDACQNQGLGTELFRRMIQVALDEKLDHIDAEIWPDNWSMKKIAKRLGFRTSAVRDPTFMRDVLDL